jgi:predicted enzyme related to lactoylglutathione lyase
MKMNPVVHFEMPAVDRKRMAEFYSNVFGWKTETMGEDMGGYVVATTTEVDQKTQRPAEPGAINGGFYQRDDSRPSEGPSVVISVDNIDEHIKKITDAGGTLLNGPDDIPGIGKYASFKDTEGNRVSILQPSTAM